jgi:2-polyprenyl-3-methyl-5-hydroxy-6-metoxy-1,4-benzoquinol methylase
MNKYSRNDHEVLNSCPWCDSVKKINWGVPVRGFKSAECKSCGLIYVQNRLNKQGLQKYYQNYLSNVHQANKKWNQQRELMYVIEFNLINSYCHPGRVLDVGCSGGYFLDHFKKVGFDCHGVEINEESVKEARKKHQIYLGDFSSIKFDKKFDLIIFRGVIEHVPIPKLYLDKAIRLLNKNGFIYITSTPNAGSLCSKLFKEKWNQHEPEAHLIHFQPAHFDDFFKNRDFVKVAEKYFYEETPYSNLEEDILKVAKAIKIKRQGKHVNFTSPPFYRNMMSLIYQKKS